MGDQHLRLPALVVVPRRPGPLIFPPTIERKDRDELDISLDEVFGEPIQQKPGPVDASLVVGGVGLIIIAEVLSGGGWLVWVGGLSVVLGLALPVRSLWRMAMRSRSTQRLASILKQGDPLNLTDATARRLAVAYTKMQQIADGGQEPAAADALEASAQALQEVAVLLKGRPPRGAAESEYVARRAIAVEGLARSLEQAHGSVASDGVAEDHIRDAAVEALTEFEKRTGMSSLDRISSIRGTKPR